MRVFSNPGGAYRRGKRARIVSLCPIIVGSWMFSELCRRDAVRRLRATRVDRRTPGAAGAAMTT